MAGLINTYRQEIRTQYPSLLDKNEWRYTRYGALEYFKKSSADPMSIVTPDLLQKVENSQGTAVKIPVLEPGTVSIGNTRNCTFSGVDNESKLVEVTFVTITANLDMVPGAYAKNDIGYLTDFQKKLTNVDHAMAKYVDTLCTTKFNTEKSQVMNSAFIGVGAKYGALVGDSIQVDSTQREYFFNDLDSIMAEDDFYGPQYDIVGTTSLMPSVSKLSNQGQGNAENSAFQFQGKEFTYTNHIANGAGVLATGYAMERGNLGVFNRNHVDSLAGRTTTTGKEWGLTRLDQLGMEVGVTYFSDCEDKSALYGSGMAHLTATTVERWQFHTDIAIIGAYNADATTQAGPVHKFEFLNGLSS